MTLQRKTLRQPKTLIWLTSSTKRNWLAKRKSDPKRAYVCFLMKCLILADAYTQATRSEFPNLHSG
jgi:hypothetical protein